MPRQGHLIRRPELQSDDEAGCPIDRLREKTIFLLLSAGGGGGARPPRFFWGSWGQSPYASRCQRAGFCIAKTMLAKEKFS